MSSVNSLNPRLCCTNQTHLRRLYMEIQDLHLLESLSDTHLKNTLLQQSTSHLFITCVHLCST